MEDFMMLIRVYYQAVMAANLGISNLAALPDLRVFKQTLHVQTVNNKLGLGEKNRCRKMLMEIYGMEEFFFKEIDASIKKHCRSVNDVRSYLFLFQGFSQELMMLMGNLMKWKFRIPSFMKKMLKSATDKSVSDIFNKQDWNDPATLKSVYAVRKYQKSLGFSQQWTSEFVYNFIVLAKREAKPSQDDIDKAEAKMKK